MLTQDVDGTCMNHRCIFFGRRQPAASGGIIHPLLLDGPLAILKSFQSLNPKLKLLRVAFSL